MGFFSAIKKFLGSEPAEKEQEKKQEAAPIVESTEGTEAAPVSETAPIVESGKAIDSTQAVEATISVETVEAIETTPTTESTESVEATEVVEATEIVAAVKPVEIDEAVTAVEAVEATSLSAEELLPEKESLPEKPLPVESLPVETIPVATVQEESAIETQSVSSDAVAPPVIVSTAAASSTAGQGSVFAIEGLSAEDQAALSLALREVEPRLSAWLAVVLDGINTVSPPLWQRLRYLLQSLDAKPEEASAFVDDFAGWLVRMEYEYVEEFRSELQYRLALALDLEDEEDERNRLFVKLSDGLARTREQFTRKLDALFASHGALDAAFWEEMEELFIMADVGFDSSMQLIERLKDGVRKHGLSEPQELRALLQEEVEKIFQMPKRIASHNPPEVIMMVGVNGVGKTTTIAKLAHRDRMQGKRVLIAAADTFRAAATEQLGVWAARVGADFHRKEAGADPAAVAFEAMDIGLRNGYDVIYIDTAGRLQTKVNLMEELKKIRNVIGKKHSGAPHRCILVIDATTGQNALSQTKMFHEASGVDEIILSKLDGTAKGGVAISVAMQFSIPITYVGLGEKLEDLRPFNGKDFALALLGAEDTTK